MSEAEVWRTVPSEPGILVSSLGRFMLRPYIKKMPNGGQRRYGGLIRVGHWDGVRYIFNWKSKRQNYKVARLVCEAFNGPPPFKDAVCMHLDENSRNNKPSNLKWGTQKENLNAPGFLAYCKTRNGDDSPRKKSKQIA